MGGGGGVQCARLKNAWDETLKLRYAQFKAFSFVCLFVLGDTMATKMQIGL